MREIKNLMKGIQESVVLAPHTTFKIGGPARFFCEVKNALEIRQAAQFAKDSNLPYYIIGNGSNILVSDRGFDGLVIKMRDTSCEFQSEKIICGGGVPLAKILNESIKFGLTGLEWAAGIPGTIGGAIYGNAGAFGNSIGDIIESVKVLNTENLADEIFTAKQCEFNYRRSIFKEKKYIILSAVLKLKKGGKDESRKKVNEFIELRRGKHPAGSSAGSVFINPLFSNDSKINEKILEKIPKAEKFLAQGKIPAGWLIEERGLKGKKIGGAMVSNEHGNFIINAGGARAEDVIMLISLIKQKIRVNCGIQLEEEIQYVGF